MDIRHVLPPYWKDEIVAYLRADAPTLDIGGYVVGDEEIDAGLLCKSSNTILSGTPFFDAVFAEVDCKVEWLAKEGDCLSSPFLTARVRGKARNILLGERTALNILARASGVATASRKVHEIAKAHKWHGEVVGTRKTTPGFRLVEKYSLLVGGAGTHRMDLSSMVMLKDNHIWAAGSITAAVAAAKKVGGFCIKIEVEAGNLKDAREAAGAGADIVMLDNYEPEALAADAAILKGEFPRILIEASGGIRESALAQYFSPHVDIISMGTLTQGYAVCDFSLKINKGGGARRIEAALAAAASGGASSSATNSSSSS